MNIICTQGFLKDNKKRAKRLYFIITAVRTLPSASELRAEVFSLKETKFLKRKTADPLNANE